MENQHAQKLPKVSIIILNWNGWKDTIECLESLYQITYPNYDVIVVDNGSEDDSVEKINEWAEGKIKVESKFFKYDSSNKPIKIIEYTRKEAEGGKKKKIENFPSNRKLIIIKNEKNYGFAEGANIGMRYALKVLNPDYVLLLNNDTVVDKEFLGELVKVGEIDEKVGIWQSKILSIKDPKRIDAIGIGVKKYGGAYQIGYGEKDNGQYEKIKEVFGACACSALYKNEMLNQIGLFDEYFFAYYEDVDLSWRARLFGWKCLYVATSVVYHVHSASGSSVKAYYLTRNILFYLLKNASIRMIIHTILKTLCSIPITILREQDAKRRSMMIRGKFDALKSIPKMLKKRKKIQSTRVVREGEIRRWFK
jgi:GT2 family glycosyltransferase